MNAVSNIKLKRKSISNTLWVVFVIFLFVLFQEKSNISKIAISKKTGAFTTSNYFLGEYGSKPFWTFKKNIDISSDSIIEMTNKERIAQGLEPFRSNQFLNDSAKRKALDMITRQYFEHDSPEGRAVSDLAHGAGYDYIIVGENLARGDFTSAKDVVQAWMESPGHRANIMNPKYQDIGAYAAMGVYNGRSVWFAVQHFGTERSVCPSIDSSLKPLVDAMNKNLNTRRSQIFQEKKILTGIHNLEDDEYKDRVAAFNNLVTQYNITLATYQEQSAVYNAQVTRFNECLLTFK